MALQKLLVSSALGTLKLSKNTKTEDCINTACHFHRTKYRNKQFLMKNTAIYLDMKKMQIQCNKKSFKAKKYIRAKYGELIPLFY